MDNEKFEKELNRQRSLDLTPLQVRAFYILWKSRAMGMRRYGDCVEDSSVLEHPVIKAFKRWRGFNAKDRRK